MEKQRRCHLRAHILNTISMIDSEGDIAFDVKDISEGGAFIYSEILFDVGEKLSLAFELPLTHRKITTSAIILRSEKNENNGRKPGMAVRFTSLSKEDSAAINNYILKYFGSIV